MDSITQSQEARAGRFGWAGANHVPTERQTDCLTVRCLGMLSTPTQLERTEGFLPFFGRIFINRYVEARRTF